MPFLPGVTYRWDALRLRRLLFWSLFITYLPASFALGLGLQLVTDSERAFPITAGVWVAAMMVTGWSLALWKCPRCSHRFGLRGLYGNLFTRKCLHCGLRRYAVHDSFEP